MIWLALVSAVGIIIYLCIRLWSLKKTTERLATRLVEIDQMKRDFISHVSHELKAPLASMQETTHLMLERIPGPLTDKQQRLLDLNRQSGKRLAQMIGNILDLSRLEAGIVEYDIQSSDIVHLMQSVVLELSGQASQKSLELLTEIQHEPLIVECDPNRMAQLFTNLLENAIHFSTKGGSIRVQVRSVGELPQMPQHALAQMPTARTSIGFALIAVTDCGPGIHDSHKRTVFDAFHQVKQGKKSFGESLGLGLPIARAVVVAHHGAIWVEDNPSGGSVFLVLLPRAAAENERVARAS